MSCKMAASKSWDHFHIDLKTAYLQGQSYDVKRDVVCQLPPEATGRSVAGIINPLVDDFFGTGGNEMEQRVL